MDSVFVREFTEDRELTAWLLVDRSASMTFGPIDRTKEQVGLEVATTFAQLLVRGGNRVGCHPVRQRRPADHTAPPGSQSGPPPAPGAAAPCRGKRRGHEPERPARVWPPGSSAAAPWS